MFIHTLNVPLDEVRSFNYTLAFEFFIVNVPLEEVRSSNYTLAFEFFIVALYVI